MLSNNQSEDTECLPLMSKKEVAHTFKWAWVHIGHENGRFLTNYQVLI